MIKEGIKNFFNSFHKPTEEDFHQKGYLSMEQFIKSGDQLTRTGWKWNDSQCKQYLMCNGRSIERISEISNIKQNVDEDGWTQLDIEIMNHQDDEIQIKRTRQYKLSITYDDYYHSARMWISGIDYENRPLTASQIFEDIMSEYQNETVTQTKHPFIGNQQISIHPCKHSEVMKTFINRANENGKSIQPHQALFLFLKLISSVMPTIEYDCSLDIDL